MSSSSLASLIQQNQQLYNECEAAYLSAWSNIDQLTSMHIADSRKDLIRREAQRDAIDSAFMECISAHPDVDENLIWNLISAAHKYNLAHLQDFGLTKEQCREAYDRCISAHQSWNKSSGHSFERYISKVHTTEMEENEVEFLLEKDILKKIKNHKLVNTQTDIEKIKKWAENFDLYAVQTNHQKMHIFGCIQIKTSIRDRVGRDDQFSKLAMEANFWVAEAVLNGQFFNLPKYMSMVNGGSETYPTNNWHGVYVMTGVETNGRIYKDDDSFSLMGNHAVQAAELFSVDRARLTREWKAK